MAWSAAHGVEVERVLTDNGSCYRSGAFRKAAAAAGVTLKKTRPYRPQTNGKVERCDLTFKREWAWAIPYMSNAARTEALGAFLHRSNHHQRHTAQRDGAHILSNNVPGNLS